ncbi:ribbon-helix-helix domain-containing protein [Candidatus Nitrospira salsa]
MTRWTLSIPNDTDRAVRSFLARRGGKKGDLSKFATEAMRREMLRQTICDLQARNADLNEHDAEELAQEAVTWARATRP